MSKRFINHCFLAVALLAAGVSCSPEKRPAGKPGGGLSDVSVAHLKSLYNGYPYTITEDYRITGMVTSTDRYGNFNKALAIEDATGGIEIRIGRNDLFEEFAPGDVVEIYCNSLVLGGYGKLAQLGIATAGSYEVGFIPWSRITEHVRKVAVSDAEPVPLVFRISDISPLYLSRFVAFEGVQFTGAEETLLWCKDGADTDRTLTDRDGNKLAVRTSAGASFADLALPKGSGRIEGILSWFNDKYQLRVVDPRAVDMDGERF